MENCFSLEFNIKICWLLAGKFIFYQIAISLFPLCLFIPKKGFLFLPAFFHTNISNYYKYIKQKNVTAHFPYTLPTLRYKFSRNTVHWKSVHIQTNASMVQKDEWASLNSGLVTGISEKQRWIRQQIQLEIWPYCESWSWNPGLQINSLFRVLNFSPILSDWMMGHYRSRPNISLVCH